jgi:adenylate cyclase
MTATNSVAQSFGISLMDDDGTADIISIANPTPSDVPMYRMDSTTTILTTAPSEMSSWRAPESWKVKADDLEDKKFPGSKLTPVDSEASSSHSTLDYSPTSTTPIPSQSKVASDLNTDGSTESTPLETLTSVPESTTSNQIHTSGKIQEKSVSPRSNNMREHPLASVSGPTTRRNSKALSGSSRSSVRIFKGAKSSLLPCTLDTSCKNILDVLRRKRFLKQDDDYMLVLKCGGLTRTLSLQERPLRIQRKTLFLYGYTERDNLDYIERTDLSFLFKFVVEEKGIEVISEEKKRVIDPQNVTLDNWNLQDIPNFLYAEPIVTLDVSQNPSFEFTKEFMHDARNLTSLKFTRSGSPAFPTAVVYAPRLTYLNLAVNYIRAIPSDISMMSTLHVLNMACNRIGHLPDTFGLLENLQTLNLASNRLKQIPPQIFKLTRLKKLDLSYNLISEIPDEIVELKTLETLQVAGNRIRGELPQVFQKFENLIKVDFRFNELTSIDTLKASLRLEVIRAGGNNISVFRSRAHTLFEVELNMNPLTYVYFEVDMLNLKFVDFSKGKLTSCAFTSRLVAVEKLSLDYNHLTVLPDHISKMTNLTHFSLHKNNITSIPDSIVKLQKLKVLDLHLNNVGRVNEKVWLLSSLELLNLASNLLEVFPDPPENLFNTYNTSAQLEKIKELGKGDDDAIEDEEEEEGKGERDENNNEENALSLPSKAQIAMRRRHSENGMSVSVVDKDIPSMASSLRELCLCDNKLTDSVFSTLSLIKNLECLNLSYNDIFEIPPGYLSKLSKLRNLFLSGNFLSSLPIEDFEELGNIEALNLNGNRFGTLPAELSMLKKLSALDVGNNQLKYNIGNVPYDWNWCYNKELKYLNLSGNKRLEIKPQHNVDEETGEKLDSFLSLKKLIMLGLMDVTITTDAVPDQSVGTRIRSTVSQIGKFGYGISDTFGSSDSLTTRDVVIEKFRGNSDEVLITIFDGKNSTQKGGDKISKIIQETFEIHLAEELKTLGECINSDQIKTVEDCLRGAFLTMNSEMSILINKDESSTFSSAAAHRTKTTDKLTLEEDGLSGCSATIIYIRGDYVYVANVGDIMGILTKSDGEFNIITTKHEPYATKEYDRIRDSGGYVTTDGKLDGVADVSRAVGFFKLMPHINAKPSIHKFKLTRNEEMIAICTSEIWKRVSFELAADIIRQEKSNPIGAAEKLRDFSISYGGKEKKMTAVVLSLRQFSMKQKHYNASKPEDSTLRKLDDEIEPPTGDLAMVFTDIKNSTLLWDSYPEAMRSAIKVHNSIMRRQLRIIGGYEVKTEGDAFIVSFPTPTAALLWCFIVQTQLLTTSEWPAEIISSDQGFEVKDNEGNLIFRGLSVRMGVHWGKPVCEMDVVTKRMDYFGPMVNRASRVSSVADGGQITMSTDFYHEMEKVKKIHQMIKEGKLDVNRGYQYKAKGRDVENQVNQLEKIGMIVENIGAKKLKGLEAPENIWVIFPKPLGSRTMMLTNKDGEIKNRTNTLEVGGINVDTAWALRKIALRLEKIASFLSAYQQVGTNAQTRKLSEDVQKEAEMKMSQKLASVESFMLVFLNHTITRIENCVTIIGTRQIVGEDLIQGRSTLDLLDIIKDMSKELCQLREMLPQLPQSSENGATDYAQLED